MRGPRRGCRAGSRRQTGCRGFLAVGRSAGRPPKTASALSRAASLDSPTGLALTHGVLAPPQTGMEAQVPIAGAPDGEAQGTAPVLQGGAVAQELAPEVPGHAQDGASHARFASGVPEAVLTSALRSTFALGLSRPAVASPAGLRADERLQTEVAQPELQEQGGDADAALGTLVAADIVLDEAQPMAVDDAGAAPRVTAKRSARAAAPSEGGNRARGGAGGQHKGKANKCVSRGGLFAMCTASPAALCVSGLPFPHLRVCCVCVSSPRVSPAFSRQQGQCPGPGSRWQR